MKQSWALREVEKCLELQLMQHSLGQQKHHEGGTVVADYSAAVEDHVPNYSLENEIPLRLISEVSTLQHNLSQCIQKWKTQSQPIQKSLREDASTTVAQMTYRTILFQMSYQKRLNIPEDIIKKFCTIGTAHKEEDFQYWFNYTCRELRSASETVTDGSGDHTGCVAVTTHLQREHRQDDIPKFLELSRKLQANPVLGRKDALLTFIVRTCEEKKKHDTSLSRHQMSRTNSSSFNQSSSSTNMASTLSKSSLSQCHDVGQRTTGSVLNRDATEAGNQSRRVSAAETVISSSRVTGVREGNVSELAVLQDLLFAFQGIGGETFRDYSGNGDFRVSTKIPPPLWRHAAYLAELGTLHVRVLSMVDSVPLLHQDGGSQLSMLRVRAMTSTSQTQMKWLATVADVCKDKKGGALLTALHSLMQHGDPKVQA
ncbi:hypothetical protein B566_EDAN012064, partial [Ephemera danica]